MLSQLTQELFREIKIYVKEQQLLMHLLLRILLLGELKVIMCISGKKAQIKPPGQRLLELQTLLILPLLLVDFLKLCTTVEKLPMRVFQPLHRCR